MACNLFTNEPSIYVDERFPKIMQDGRDGDEDPAYLGAIVDGTTVGFKYFDMKNIHQISIDVRGYIKGSFEVKNCMGWQSAGTDSSRVHECMETL